MKKQLQLGLFATALLCSVNTFAQDGASAPAPAAAQPGAESAAPATIEQNGQKYTLVSTIKTVAANREFQHNVGVVQAQLKAAQDYKRRIDIALTTPEKEALQVKFGEVVKELEANNKLMAKTYGFSLERNYVVQIVKTRLYTPVSDEEVKKMEERVKDNTGEKAPEVITVDQKDKDGKDIKAKLLFIAAINGVAENDIFRQNVQLVQTQYQRLVRIKQAIDKAPAGEDKTKLEAELKKSEETLQKNNDEMIKTYGFSLMRNYTMEIEEARLYAHLSEEDLKRFNEASAAGQTVKP